MPREIEDDTVEEEAEETQQPEAPRLSPPKRKKGTGSVVTSALPSDAGDLWGLYVAKMLADVGRTPFDVRIRVFQVEPPSAVGDNVVIGNINGGNVKGDIDNPASIVITQYICDHFHMPRPQSRGVVRYKVQFLWAQNSQYFANAELTLPPRDEIIAMRSEGQRLQQQQASGGQYQPPPLMPQQPPMSAMSPQTFGYPMPPQQQDAMPAVLAMMQEMWRASIEQRAPQITPAMAAQAGIAAPVAPPLNEEAIVAKTTAGVLMALKQAGVLQPAVVTPPPAAAIVAATPPTSVSSTGFQGSFEKALGRIFDAAVGQVEKSMKDALTGVGRVVEEEEEEETPVKTAAVGVGGVANPAAETKPADPLDSLPFIATALPEAKWGDGRPVVYAVDRKTGNVDWQGVLFSNPIVGEKVMGVAGGLVEAATEVVKRIGVAASTPSKPPPQQPVIQPPQIVSEIPPAAVDAGNGEPAWKL